MSSSRFSVARIMSCISLPRSLQFSRLPRLEETTISSSWLKPSAEYNLGQWLLTNPWDCGARHTEIILILRFFSSS